MRTKVLIMRGAPGSGKDTFLHALSAASGFQVEICGADQYFTSSSGDYRYRRESLQQAHNACFRAFVSALEREVAPLVGVSNTNIRLFEASPYYLFARAMGFEVNVVEMPFVHPDLLAKRNLHGVPASKIEKMEKRFEPSPPFWSGVVQIHVQRGQYNVVPLVDGCWDDLPRKFPIMTKETA